MTTKEMITVMQTYEMTTKEMIAVMQAYEDGKKIQFKTKASLNQWKDIDEPHWDWELCDYRIKPEEKPVRMTNRQLAEWLAKGNGQMVLVDEKGQIDSLDFIFTHSNFRGREGGEFVDQDTRIRSWDSNEWVKPTVDIYNRDCKSYCRTTLA